MAAPSNSGEDHPSNELKEFCNALEQDSVLQAKVKAAENPQQIIDIARSIGCEFTLVELRIWSRELSGYYFPWAAKGSEWRRNFFRVS
jgi:predicted ribosomally synthesized peptide with nif11-like leader